MKGIIEKLLNPYPRFVFFLVAIKVLFAFFTPLTSDEAYFWQWGQNLSPTYYDHPFWTGVWMYWGQWFGDSIFFPRMVSIFSQLLVFWGILYLAKLATESAEKAKVIGAIYLLSPAHFLFFLVTTDSPLFFFSFFCVFFFYLAIKRDQGRFFVIAGLLLGMALLSKYLVFFLGCALLVSCFFLRPFWRGVKAIFLLGVGFLVPFAVNIWIASDYCWWPLQFNVFNRSQGKTASWDSFQSFLIQQLFLLGPWLVFFALKRRKVLLKEIIENRSMFLCIYLIGLLFLGATSIYAIGLHWGLLFYSFAFLGFSFLPIEDLKKSLGYSFVFSSLMAVVIFAILVLLPSKMKDNRYYADYVMGAKGSEVHQALKDFASNEEVVFGTLGYTTAAMMHYHSKYPYLVFNDYDTNGRNDDLWTDYSTLDGKDFVIVSTYSFREYERQDYQLYFKEVEYKEILVAGAKYYVFKGKSFLYPVYLSKYLTKIDEDFYTFKIQPKRCFFKEKYGF